jgi:hypothetical protein
MMAVVPAMAVMTAVAAHNHLFDMAAAVSGADVRLCALHAALRSRRIGGSEYGRHEAKRGSSGKCESKLSHLFLLEGLRFNCTPLAAIKQSQHVCSMNCLFVMQMN